MEAAKKQGTALVLKDGKSEIKMIPIDLLIPNEWNPNVMDDTMFNELVHDIQEGGYLQPILVAPVKDEKGKTRYRVIDGEHRYKAMELLEMSELPCVVAKGELASNELKQKIKTVRMNKIRGSLDQKKFKNLLKDVATQLPMDEMAKEFIYDDPAELQALMEEERKNLPTEELRKEFDKAKKEIKTIDDLTTVLNNLFANYGSTLSHHYMVIEWGGKEHLWVRIDDKKAYVDLLRRAEMCKKKEVTFDSAVTLLLRRYLTEQFIDENISVLQPPDKE